MLGMYTPYPTWSTGNYTATAGTAIAAFIPPMPGGGGPPVLFKVDGSGNALWNRGTGTGRAHIARLLYTSSTTAHTITVMRPLNWTYTTAVVAAGGTSFSLKADPGVYSTNYKYPLPSGQAAPANVADNAIASGDYVMYQLLDGTWVLDTAAGSYTSGAVTMTTGAPNITGGGVAINSPVFWFGAPGDTDPATGQKHFAVLSKASTTKEDIVPDQLVGFVASLHPGDPLIVESNNATAAGTLDAVSAYYARL